PIGRGFDEWISTDDHGDYTNFLMSQSITPDKQNRRFSELAISNLPVELSRPRFLEKCACEFIEKHQRDPFILVVGFVEPHSPYNVRSTMNIRSIRLSSIRRPRVLRAEIFRCVIG